LTERSTQGLEHSVVHIAHDRKRIALLHRIFGVENTKAMVYNTIASASL
jgi:hypothetical protein